MKRVVKIGGRAQSSSDLAERIAAAWRESPGSLCVVHGGGDRISEFQRRVGLEPSFVDGRRVTTRQDMEIVRMVLSGLVNKELVAAFSAAGVPGVGISGEDAGMITATPIDATGLGRTGKPVAVRSELIELLLDGGYLPVISPLAAEDGPTGEALNVNADDAAAAIAIALAASELLLIVDVEGVLDETGKRIASLDQSDAGELIQNGVINRGMRAKLEAGFAALAGGVGRVRISTLEGLTDSASGTLLTFAQSLIT
jgi:acetylglutamate kinase